MRRLIIIIAILVASLASAAAFAGDAPVRVFVNGNRAKLRPAAIIRDGKAYVCILSASCALNAEVDWIDSSNTAVITVGNKRTKIPQSECIVIDGLPYLPLRTTGEAVGCGVSWDRDSRAIKVTSEAAPPKCYG